VEHPDGLIAIDAGLARGVRVPRAQRRFAPTPAVKAEEEIGPQMRARGLSPGDVRLVVLTHLDWDHVGGVRHFPLAQVLVHRPEREAAATFRGRQRYQTRRWPTGFAPTIYDLDPEPYGPFPAGRAVTADGDVRIVPIPGHSAGQVGVAVERAGAALLFSADHMLRQDWFVEDPAAGRLGIWHRERDRDQPADPTARARGADRAAAGPRRGCAGPPGADGADAAGRGRPGAGGLVKLASYFPIRAR
jgi:N-acyl homoserine lactone hydrolase